MKRICLIPLILLAMSTSACNDKDNNPVKAGGDENDFFPKPIDNENTNAEGLSIVRHKEVKLSFDNFFGANTKTVFVGDHILSPSCFIAAPGAGPQIFSVNIKTTVSSLQISTQEDLSGAGVMIYENFFDVINKAQETGSFQSEEAENSLFKNVTVNVKFAGTNNSYGSNTCTLKAEKLVVLKEGPESGPDAIHALTFKAECKTMDNANTTAPLTNVVASFTCLVE